MTRAAPALAAAFACCLAGCADIEDQFKEGRTYDACTSVVPVCTTSASCVLSEANYTGGNFSQGTTRRVIVRTTTSAAEIQVDLFFRTQLSPGTSTEITWSEVGCRDRFTLDNQGKDIFREAGDGRIWSRTGKVFTPGDHLIEVFSDAQADYLLRVFVRAVQ